MAQYTGLTADTIWRQVVSDLLESPSYTTDSRGGEVAEFLQCSFTLKNPRRRWILSRQPAYNPAYGLVEFIWILSGRSESDLLRFWNPNITQYAGSDKNFHGAYGYRLRTNFKFDQLHRAYLTLKSNPNSRQVVLQIWDPTKDFPDTSGQPASPDIPCNIVSFLKIRDNQLHWTQVMRSNDVIRGLPYNIIQFTMLHEMFTSWLSCELGTYMHLSDSMHMYKSDMDDFNILIGGSGITNNSSDLFSLPYDETMFHVDEIYSDLLSVTLLHNESNKNATKERLNSIFNPSYANKSRPVLFNDALCVIGSDAARRLGDIEFAYELAIQCHDLELRTAATNWLDRHNQKRELS